MANTPPYGRILQGDEATLRQSYAKWEAQPVDEDRMDDQDGMPSPRQTTIGGSTYVTGQGTFLGRAQRTLTFVPSREEGWWFDRLDVPGALPIRVSAQNVWRTVRNIVLCSGSPHNYMRMVEHIIALKLGMGLDNVVIRMDSGDPPLFERGSLDLVDAIDSVGLVELQRDASWVTVKEPVSAVGRNGSFLTFLPAESGDKKLTIDCALDFSSAIGKQRIRFVSNLNAFRHGAYARTNTTLLKMIYCRTIGKIFADIRNLGYTSKNILIAGPRSYYNEPRHCSGGKSLEAAWHRATLDLLAAVGLIDGCRFAGHIISYKAGHTLDVEMVRVLYKRDMLCAV